MKVVDGGLLEAVVCVLLLCEPRAWRNGRVMQPPLKVPTVCEAPCNAYSPNSIQSAVRNAVVSKEQKELQPSSLPQHERELQSVHHAEASPARPRQLYSLKSGYCGNQIRAGRR